jgi:hypothetical protein
MDIVMTVPCVPFAGENVICMMIFIVNVERQAVRIAEKLVIYAARSFVKTALKHIGAKKRIKGATSLFLGNLEIVSALGVDTLTCWSTGPGGWRSADRWLRQQYPAVRNSVVTPNGLFGSMGLNGMAVLISARKRFDNLFITETHPKVLYWQITRARYDYFAYRGQMDQVLASRQQLPI